MKDISTQRKIDEKTADLIVQLGRAEQIAFELNRIATTMPSDLAYVRSCTIHEAIQKIQEKTAEFKRNHTRTI